KSIDVSINDCCFCAPRGIHRNTQANRIKQGLVSHRLREEIDRARLHSLHSHWNVAVPGQENNWLWVAMLCQMILQIEAVLSGHANVEYEAPRPVHDVGLQQF